MKLNVFLLGSSLALGPDIQRYLYDNPLCDSIEVCNGNKGKQGSTCKGRLFEGRTKGRIRLGKYDDQFNCRWEVKVPKDKQIKFRLQQVKIEHHKTCGNDKLFIIDGQKENGNGNGIFARVCSNKSGGVYNGLAPNKSPNGIKINPQLFSKQSYLTDTNHLVFAFDSDQDTRKGGFSVLWEVYDPENVAQATKDALADMKAETTKAIELFLDETGNIKKKPQPLINSKAKLVSNALKTFDHVERLWYMCGTASRDPNMANVLRNNMCQNKFINASTFKKCLTQEFDAWTDENIKGCKESHIEKLKFKIDNLMTKMQDKACNFKDDKHC